jgi:hypothetical protein
LFFGISLFSCRTYVYIAHFEIGFDWVRLALFSSSGQWWFSLVTLCGKEGCVGFVVAKIGFVLRKKRAICREISTYAEGLQGKATDLGVVGVGECLGLGSYDENLVLWYLLLTSCYLLLRTDYLVLAIGYRIFVRCILYTIGSWVSSKF